MGRLILPGGTDSKQAKLQRMYGIIQRAHTGNPYSSAVMSSPPTITVAATSDGTLTNSPLTAASALTSAALTQVAWYGGVPTPILTNYVCMPVASILPSTAGNIGSGMLDKNQWASAMEIVTDSDKVQFGVYISSAAKLMFQVDGQYVDMAGTPGNNAANTDTFFLLTFASKKPRRIRVLAPNLPSKGATLYKSIRITTGCSFWKPSQADVLRLGWAGDSYSEGTNGAASIYPIPNAAWPVLTGELLGFRDVRQLAVGSCGYVSDNAGVRSKMIDQMPRWANQAPFDLFVFANGYNDSASSAATITAQVSACLAYARTNYPSTPIVVLGCQAGNAAPSAAQITCEGAIQSAVTALNDPYVKFAPVSTDTPTWLNSGNASVYVDADNTHPNVAGAEFISYRARNAVTTAIASMIS